MQMAKMPFVIILVSCWALSGATATQKNHQYTDTGLNDKMFTTKITFNSTAASALHCGIQCSQHNSCVAFTFHQNACRGRSVPITLCSAFTTTPGAKSYVRKSAMKPRVRCEMTGVKKVTHASTGLDLDVYCEDDWLVFQKRQDGSVGFYRNWQNYTNGFGDVNGEYWLGVYIVKIEYNWMYECGFRGLEPLHRITSQGNYQLKVDLRKWNGTTASAMYSCFSVGSAEDLYTLHLGSFLGGAAGDSLMIHRNRPFSTFDKDNDKKNGNCAMNINRGAWWYYNCMMSNLNGRYKSMEISGLDGIVWKAFNAVNSLASCKMMIKPA